MKPVKTTTIIGFSVGFTIAALVVVAFATGLLNIESVLSGAADLIGIATAGVAAVAVFFAIHVTRIFRDYFCNPHS